MGAVGELGLRALARPGPREEPGRDSLPWLLPIATMAAGGDSRRTRRRRTSVAVV